ncbi:EAL and HDOD domain-containing protein [Pelomonas aquatica]|jgi:EAL and modified HD-GYP domain-containing signal transduction protein|uniref:HDOD domain-containing protein n=1 Tax=Pelomonas aquatica TaxID=431058 RepID=A0A9X4LM79_9BURK|nr:HDOD domain-containing protein [Pelomonas aquatica]MCY4756200.1 HDOD domain-containing protein [Pelomonas aquatica]MDG0863485.1 HDOD domain-containing protein [Pelomonas aquatica]
MSDTIPAALDHAILPGVALGYAPVIDRQRAIACTRLTLIPLRADAKVDQADLLAALAAVWPQGGELLNPQGEALLGALLNEPPAQPVQIEVPAFIAADAAHAPALAALKAAGHTGVLKGLPQSPLPADVAKVFRQVVLEPGQAAPAGVPTMHAGVRGAEAINASFGAGVNAVIGWPMDGPYEAAPGAGKAEIATDLQVIMELMSRLDQGEDVERLEQSLKRDPSLAFKLLRYLNSAAFGLPVEVSSFRHAIMLLGYARMKRWLALLLTTASKDHSMRPIMYGALRRGLLMEEFAQSMSEREQRDEMFICGLFSLLDHMLRQPFEKLLQSIPVPERVRQALVEDSGPYQPYLALLRAIEAESVFDYRECAETLMLGAGEINACLLRALHKATQLE